MGDAKRRIYLAEMLVNWSRQPGRGRSLSLSTNVYLTPQTPSHLGDLAPCHLPYSVRCWRGLSSPALPSLASARDWHQTDASQHYREVLSQLASPPSPPSLEASTPPAHLLSSVAPQTRAPEIPESIMEQDPAGSSWDRPPPCSLCCSSSPKALGNSV